MKQYEHTQRSLSPFEGVDSSETGERLILKRLFSGAADLLILLRFHLKRGRAREITSGATSHMADTWHTISL
jgi:hypothetical protein